MTATSSNLPDKANLANRWKNLRDYLNANPGAAELSDLTDVVTTAEALFGGLLWDGSTYVHGQPVVLLAAAQHPGPTALTGTSAAPALITTDTPTLRSTVTLSSNTWRVQDPNYAASWLGLEGTFGLEETAGSTAEVEINADTSANGSTWATYDQWYVTLAANEKKVASVIARPTQLADADSYIRFALKEVSGSVQVLRRTVLLKKVADDNDAA